MSCISNGPVTGLCSQPTGGRVIRESKMKAKERQTLRRSDDKIIKVIRETYRKINSDHL
jgi:hypothetical protein